MSLSVVLQLLGDLPSPIPEEPSHLGTAPASPQTPRPHPSAERSLETKAAPFLAAALHQSRPTHWSSFALPLPLPARVQFMPT